MINTNEMLAQRPDNFVKYDVKVINAYKSYDSKNTILGGLNMNVESGSIYGLLGPSGCGKSTLFQCILGTIPLNSGKIEFNVQSLKDVGYMPQDLCMDVNLTIKETFEYYGTLYTMDKAHIAKKVEELTQFLKLPDFNSYIGELSGGQSRRVSLAICLLHDPKIILMDEPTVGIDSLLRHEIWMEFTKMVEQHKKTIIITTHYIEEANKAHCVGLMRNGVLVEEASPQDILVKYNTDTLESAFLKLCCSQKENHIDHNDVRLNLDNPSQSNKLIKFDSKINFTRIKALIKKYIHLFSRDYILLFTMFILPILQAIVICNCIGTDIKDMSVAVKNDEIDFWDSRRRSNIDGCILGEQTDQKISGVIMNRLESLGYTLNEVPDHHTGEMVMDNSSKYIAFIHFPKNYTSAFTEYIEDRENYDYQSQVYMNVAQHNVLFKYKMVFDIKNTLDRVTANILSGCSYNGKALRSLDIPLDFTVIVGQDVKSYNNSIIAIFVVMGAFYFPCVFSLSMMLTERMDGILIRSMFAGVKVTELLISLFVIASVLIIVQMVFPVLIAYVFYENPIQVTSGLIAYEILMIFTGWTGFFYGLLVACMSPTKLVGISIINGFSFSQALISGAVWPVESQTTLLRMITELLPMRLAGNVMTNIALKGWTLGHPPVVTNIVVMFLYNVVLVLVIFGMGKVKKNMWIMYK